MSDRYFPSMPGLVLVAREPFFVNSNQESDSGVRYSIRKRKLAGYRYTYEVRALRPWLGESAALFSFFEDHGGSYESFLLIDEHDGSERRVHFVSDDLGLKRMNGGIYRGEVELETVVTANGDPADMATYVTSVFTTATRPTPSALWRGCEIRVKDAGADEQVQVCLQQADGSYAWIVVAY